jgi:hypothetical protein
MVSEHEVRIPGREGVALDLVRELIQRGFENPKETSDFLQLYCRCLVTLCDPVGALAQAASGEAKAQVHNSATVEAGIAADARSQAAGDF